MAGGKKMDKHRVIIAVLFVVLVVAMVVPTVLSFLL